MKKFLSIMLIVVLAIFCLAACSSENADDTITADEDIVTEDFATDDGIITDNEDSEVTLYANGGTIWMGPNEPYKATLCVASIEKGLTFLDGIGPISSIEMDGATFAGWTVYAVTSGEWLSEEVTDLAEGQLCVPCGEYGYYLMDDYELLIESATTEEMMSYVVDGRDYYAYAIWE